MPPVLARVSEWPAQLQRLVEQYGPAKVWSIGLSALGFPPTWVHATNEALIVLSAIERN